MATFKSSHPIGFELFNAQGHSVLYIEKDNQELTLELVNQGPSDLSFLPVDQKSAADKYHFELTFRPGIIDPACIRSKTLKLSDKSEKSWSLTTRIAEADASVRLFLKAKKDPKNWAKGARYFITICGLGAASIHGTQVTRVQLKLNHCQSLPAQVTLDVVRQTQLKIVDHQGSGHSPLEVSVVGDPALLNDGSTRNSVTIRLINTARYDEINPKANLLRFRNDELNHSNRSRLIFQFSKGSPDEVSAMATASQVDSIEMKQPDHWKKEKNTSTEWVIYPEKEFILYPKGYPTTEVNIPESNYLEVTFTNFITQGIPGKGLLNVRYENVHGYWDGCREVALEKRLFKFLGSDTNSPMQMNLPLRVVTSPTEMSEDAAAVESNSENISGKTSGPKTYNVKEEVGHALYVEQKQNMIPCAGFRGGTVLIKEVEGDQHALKIAAKTSRASTFITNEGTGYPLYVKQLQKANKNQKASPCAGFEGGTVLIHGVEGKDNALDISGDTSNPTVYLLNKGSGVALNVVQKGTGSTAQYSGGKVKMSHVHANKNVLEVLGRTSGRKSNTYLQNRGTGHALGVSQKASGPCAYFAGGQVTIKEVTGETHALQIDASTTKNAAVQISNNGSGASLEVAARGSGICAEFKGSKTIFHGNVGIDEPHPTWAKLEISGYEYHTIDNGYGFLNEEGDTGNYDKNQQAPNYSIYAKYRIAASEFNAHSDERIKEIDGNSNGSQDLNTLLRIQIRNYKYKDPALHGVGPQKKVIGQQIAQVFAQAVSKENGTIPDIQLHKTIKEGWIDWPNHNLQEGERIKVVFPDHQSRTLQVQYINEQGIQLNQKSSGEIFLYGREVDDFHVVDYDAISMLHVSATQALHAKVEAQAQEITALRQELKELREFMNQLKSVIANA